MEWDFILSIIVGVIIGCCIPIDKKRKDKRKMGIKLMKEDVNQLHNKMAQTDRIFMTKFISNPNKEHLTCSELLELHESICELESLIPIVKHRIIEQMVLLDKSTLQPDIELVEVKENDVGKQS